MAPIGTIGVAQVLGGGAPKTVGQKFADAFKAAQAKAQPPRADTPAKPQTRQTAAVALDRVTAAQTRMDEVLKLAQSGKTFTPAELLSLQTQVYRASQELDLAGKVVEKTTGGIKQVLQTQV